MDTTSTLWIAFGHGGPVAPVIVILGLLFLIINILATISILKGRLTLIAKVLWLLGVWLLSPFGALLYFLLGRTKR